MNRKRDKQQSDQGSQHGAAADLRPTTGLM
jgi:hypothetical protein